MRVLSVSHMVAEVGIEPGVSCLLIRTLIHEESISRAHLLLKDSIPPELKVSM